MLAHWRIRYSLGDQVKLPDGRVGRVDDAIYLQECLEGEARRSARYVVDGEVYESEQLKPVPFRARRRAAWMRPQAWEVGRV